LLDGAVKNKEIRMKKRRRSTMAAGVLLVLVGILAIVLQNISETPHWLFSWPLIIVGVGVFLLLMGLLMGEPGMAVPACIVGGIGGLLYYQNATGNWESWSYAWTLIPGFVGLGILVSGLLEGRGQKALREGGWMLVISAVLFLVFGSFLGNLNLLGPYWPLVLVAIGILILVGPMLRSRR
jgi:hypothetical protein